MENLKIERVGTNSYKGLRNSKKSSKLRIRKLTIKLIDLKT